MKSCASATVQRVSRRMARIASRRRRFSLLMRGCGALGVAAALDCVAVDIADHLLSCAHLGGEIGLVFSQGVYLSMIRFLPEVIVARKWYRPGSHARVLISTSVLHLLKFQ